MLTLQRNTTPKKMASSFSVFFLYSHHYNPFLHREDQVIFQGVNQIMAHSWLKCPQVSAALKIKPKLISRAHVVSCLSFHGFISLLPFQSSALVSLTVILLKWWCFFPPQGFCLCCSLWEPFPEYTGLIATVPSDLSSNVTSSGSFHYSTFKFCIQELRTAFLSIWVWKRCYWGHGKSWKVTLRLEQCVH